MSRIIHLKPTAIWKGVCALGAAAVCLGLTALRPGRGQPVEIIPAGGTLAVLVMRPLSSETVVLGDIIEGKVVSFQGSDSEASLPPGTRVQLRCVAVRKAEGNVRPGYLRLTLTSLEDSGGNFRSVETSTFSQWGEERAREVKGALPGARSAALQGSAMSGALQAPLGQVNEAVITPDVRLTFVLLKPAVLDGLQSSR